MRRFRSVVRPLAVLMPVAAGLAVVGYAVAPAGAAPGNATASAPEVVVSGLNNPRQLSLVRGRELLIAEAGRGGKTQIGSGDDAEYVGKTGSVSAVLNPGQALNQHPYRVVKGLVSASGQGGVFAVGADGVSARRVGGAIYSQETYAPPDVLSGPVPGEDQLGKLLITRPYRATEPVADISAYETNHDPDGQGFDSNPYAVLALPGGSELVADAAGNDVLRVGPDGKVHLWHLFPNITDGACAGQNDPTPDFPGCNFVPTSLARDNCGHIYVGALASETPGAGRVEELSADGRHVVRVIKGFTSVSGVAVGPRGGVYVSQLEAQEANPPNDQTVGVLTRVQRNGQRQDVDVPFPAGVAVGRDGQVFVSAFSVAPASGLAGPGTSGQVWRLHFMRSGGYAA